MTVALTGGGCGKASIEAEKRIIHCNISIGIWSTVLPWADPHKMGGNYLTRALVRIELGEFAQAKKDMAKALSLASFGEPRTHLLIYLDLPKSFKTDPSYENYWLASLFVRVNKPDTPEKAKKIWADVIYEALE